jgi:SAM-dependent methyltransferase
MTPAAKLARRLPPPLERLLQRAYRSPRLRRTVRPVRWGSLRRVEPVSRGWGSARGTVIDRYYIERFFDEHRQLIRGRVLEVRDPQYTQTFGTGVTAIDIVDIDPRNEQATIVADISDPGSLPAEAFDCAVVPQTLQYVPDPMVATANLWRSLAPGGALLVTVPSIARVDPAFSADDRWRFTAVGLAELARRACPHGEVAVRAYGNPLVAVAFLHGLAREELRQQELDAAHEHFPIVASAVVKKPPFG